MGFPRLKTAGAGESAREVKQTMTKPWENDSWEKGTEKGDRFIFIVLSRPPLLPVLNPPPYDRFYLIRKSLLAFPGGHIGIYVSGKAQKEVTPAIGEWLNTRS